MVRVHAEQALGERDRRDHGAEPVAKRDAQAIARAQLQQIAEVQAEAVETLVLDMPALLRCEDDLVEPVKLFAEEILRQRGLGEWSRDEIGHRAQGKIFLRRPDTDTLSDLLHCQPEAVTPLLSRMGLLA